MEQNIVRCVAVNADDTSYAAVYAKWMCLSIHAKNNSVWMILKIGV